MSSLQTPPRPAPRKINWLIFLVVLLAPAVLTLLSARAKLDGAAVCCPFIGGAMGILCGILLARRLGKTSGMRVVLGLAFSALLGGLSFFLSFFGCMAGGYRIDLR